MNHRHDLAYYKENPSEFVKDFLDTGMLIDDPWQLDERFCSKERWEAIQEWFREPLVKVPPARIISFRIPDHEYEGWEKNFFGIIDDLHNAHWSSKYKSEDSEK